MMPYGKTLQDFREEGEILLIDKPLDWTSFDVVRKVRNLFGVKKVGHAGTLDPKATGLLIVCTGRKTRAINTFVVDEKEYVGSFELGVRTPSLDSETDVSEKREYTHISKEMLEEAAGQFVGTISQKPPMYSAAKTGGKPLYAYARKGEIVERLSREVEIREFGITEFASPMVHFRVVCSKGTYVRTLVDDLGMALGCGCTLRSLRRVRIGAYSVGDALGIEDLVSLRKTLEGSDRMAYEVSESAS
jgi:tRNA pseudouridine55 synthase